LVTVIVTVVTEVGTWKAEDTGVTERQSEREGTRKYKVQYPCEQIQDYTQTIKTPGQENPRRVFCVGRLDIP